MGVRGEDQALNPPICATCDNVGQVGRRHGDVSQLDIESVRGCNISRYFLMFLPAVDLT